jgi:hypothetical protein
VQRLVSCCLNDACRHTALIHVSATPPTPTYRRSARAWSALSAAAVGTRSTYGPSGKSSCRNRAWSARCGAPAAFRRLFALVGMVTPPGKAKSAAGPKGNERGQSQKPRSPRWLTPAGFGAAPQIRIGFVPVIHRQRVGGRTAEHLAGEIPPPPTGRDIAVLPANA